MWRRRARSWMRSCPRPSTTWPASSATYLRTRPPRPPCRRAAASLLAAAPHRAREHVVIIGRRQVKRITQQNVWENPRQFGLRELPGSTEAAANCSSAHRVDHQNAQCHTDFSETLHIRLSVHVSLVLQNPIQAIVQHSEHGVLYAADPLMQGFHGRHISHLLDIVCENQGQTGFSVAEVGAGTGGFTRQVHTPILTLSACPPNGYEPMQVLGGVYG